LRDLSVPLNRLLDVGARLHQIFGNHDRMQLKMRIECKKPGLRYSWWRLLSVLHLEKDKSCPLPVLVQKVDRLGLLWISRQPVIG
jgi:hypothetical protein